MTIGLTALVLVAPCLAAVGLRAFGLVTSPILLIVIPVLVSILISHGLIWLWKRRRFGGTATFEELMLWGWLRQRRFERLLARSEEFVGSGDGRSATSKVRARELERLAAALEARDPHTHGHSKRVARHAAMIARALNLESAEIARIRTAALLHDIGKIEIPREILDKPGKLTDDEMIVMRTHPVAGARMVEAMGDPELTAIVLHHHERIDGGGYPDGLVRGQIPIGARIIAVADTFDALTSARTYHQPRSHQEALTVIREEAGSQLDSRAVRVFDGRYSSHRPVALAAVALGVFRQAGQSLVSFGTGASQVAAVGAAAAVIGAGPAVHAEHQNQKPSEQPSIVREADVADGIPVSEAGATAQSLGASSGSQQGPEQLGAKRHDGEETGLTPGRGDDPSGNDGDGDNGGDSDGATGGSSGGDDGGGTDVTAEPAPEPTAPRDPVKTVVETVQKPAQRVTDQVTEAIPTLPGDDPLSKSVNDTITGVKDTVGGLTGNP